MEKSLKKFGMAVITYRSQNYSELPLQNLQKFFYNKQNKEIGQNTKDSSASKIAL